MREVVLVLMLMASSGVIGFRLGEARATARFQVETVTATQNIKESTRRASDALSHASKTISDAEMNDRTKLMEITNVATSVGDQCHVDADRLRALDAIAR